MDRPPSPPDWFAAPSKQPPSSAPQPKPKLGAVRKTGADEEALAAKMAATSIGPPAPPPPLLAGASASIRRFSPPSSSVPTSVTIPRPTMGQRTVFFAPQASTAASSGGSAGGFDPFVPRVVDAEPEPLFAARKDEDFIGNESEPVQLERHGSTLSDNGPLRGPGSGRSVSEAAGPPSTYGCHSPSRHAVESGKPLVDGPAAPSPSVCVEPALGRIAVFDSPPRQLADADPCQSDESADAEPHPAVARPTIVTEVVSPHMSAIPRPPIDSANACDRIVHASSRPSSGEESPMRHASKLGAVRRPDPSPAGTPLAATNRSPAAAALSPSSLTVEHSSTQPSPGGPLHPKSPSFSLSGSEDELMTSAASVASLSVSAAAVVCIRCDKRNDPEANFCCRCGKRLREGAAVQPISEDTLSSDSEERTAAVERRAFPVFRFGPAGAFVACWVGEQKARRKQRSTEMLRGLLPGIVPELAASMRVIQPNGATREKLLAHWQSHPGIVAAVLGVCLRRGCVDTEAIVEHLLSLAPLVMPAPEHSGPDRGLSLLLRNQAEAYISSSSNWTMMLLAGHASPRVWPRVEERLSGALASPTLRLLVDVMLGKDRLDLVGVPWTHAAVLLLSYGRLADLASLAETLDPEPALLCRLLIPGHAIDTVPCPMAYPSVWPLNVITTWEHICGTRKSAFSPQSKQRALQAHREALLALGLDEDESLFDREVFQEALSSDDDPRRSAAAPAVQPVAEATAPAVAKTPLPMRPPATAVPPARKPAAAPQPSGPRPLAPIPNALSAVTVVDAAGSPFAAGTRPPIPAPAAAAPPLQRRRSIDDDVCRRSPSPTPSTASARDESSSSASVLSRVRSWFSRSSASTSGAGLGEKPAVKANLGEKSTFRYDEQLGRWVDDDDPSTMKALAAPPPPPTASVSILSSSQSTSSLSSAARMKSARSRYVSEDVPAASTFVVPAPMPLAGGTAAPAKAMASQPQTRQSSFVPFAPAAAAPREFIPDALPTAGAPAAKRPLAPVPAQHYQGKLADDLDSFL